MKILLHMSGGEGQLGRKPLWVGRKPSWNKRQWILVSYAAEYIDYMTLYMDDQRLTGITSLMQAYSKLLFFVQDQTYWIPASTTSELYTQLASRRYREIPRNQIMWVCITRWNHTEVAVIKYWPIWHLYIEHKSQKVWLPFRKHIHVLNTAWLGIQCCNIMLQPTPICVV